MNRTVLTGAGVVVAILVGSILVFSGGGPGAATPAPSATTVLSAGSAAPSASSGAAQSAAATARPSGAAATANTAAGSTPTVNLVFTGSRNFTLKGAAGTCRKLNVAGVDNYPYNATTKDAPEIDGDFSLVEISGRVDLKWAMTKAGYGRPATAGTWTVSADHRTYTIDSDLSEFLQNGVGPGPEHLAGTVTCS